MTGGRTDGWMDEGRKEGQQEGRRGEGLGGRKGEEAGGMRWESGWREREREPSEGKCDVNST